MGKSAAGPKIREMQDQLRDAARQLHGQTTLCRALSGMARNLRTSAQEFHLAAELQQRLLPDRLPTVSGVRISRRCLHAAHGGSDLHDVFDVGDGVVGFLVAEASGTGLCGALMLTHAKVAFDAARTHHSSPAPILEEANRQIFLKRPNSHYLRSFMGVLDLRAMRLKYVGAGHRPPLLLGARGVRALMGEKECLGRTERVRLEEREVQLRPGDRLLLHSAGLTAAKDYSLADLKRCVAAHSKSAPEDMIQQVIKDHHEHLKGAHPPADVTLIAVELSRELSRELKMIIPTEPGRLSRVVAAVMEKLGSLNYGERSQFAVRLCLEEALINAMKHGNRMDRSKKITVTCEADDHGLKLSVEDEGQGFHPEAVPDPTRPENLEVTHGRGLLLMRSYMDKVTHNEKGTKITFEKKAPWE
jgi:serine phosphatase RsbU (regulator of sigma subunit)/anti-sigma regulatory factor (Ser/Thr protein kinase)